VAKVALANAKSAVGLKNEVCEPLTQTCKDSPIAAPPAVAIADQSSGGDQVSPALRLRQELETRLSADTVPGMWSSRATLLFILGACGGFWLLVAWGMAIHGR
jgi:hypothetical protein